MQSGVTISRRGPLVFTVWWTRINFCIVQEKYLTMEISAEH